MRRLGGNDLEPPPTQTIGLSRQVDIEHFIILLSGNSPVKGLFLFMVKFKMTEYEKSKWRLVNKTVELADYIKHIEEWCDTVI